MLMYYVYTKRIKNKNKKHMFLDVFSYDLTCPYFLRA